MADRIIKPDSGNDVVIQNNAGTRKIEVTNSGDVEVTGDFKATTVKATNLKANDGTAGLEVADSTGEVTSSGGLKAVNIKATNIKANDGTAGLSIADSTGQVTASGKIDLNGNELILDADADTSITSDTDDRIDFKTAGSDRVHIDSTGNVGINTATPNFLSHAGPVLSILGGSTSNNAVIELANPNAGSYDGLGQIEFLNFDGGSTVTARAVIVGGHDGADDSSNLKFYTEPSGGAIAVRMTINSSGAVSVAGALSKGSGSFKIDHPLESKSSSHHLVHSFIEGPQADLIYRGLATLLNGEAIINLDTIANMTEGTFVALNTNTQCFTSNETSFGPVKGSLSGNILTITAQDNTSSDTISWLVIGERHDSHMIETDWTDENGKVIVEPQKPIIDSKVST